MCVKDFSCLHPLRWWRAGRRPIVTPATCWLGIVGKPGRCSLPTRSRSRWRWRGSPTQRKRGDTPAIVNYTSELRHGTLSSFPLVTHLHRQVSEARGGEREQRRGRSGGRDEGRRDQRRAGDGFPVGVNEEEGSCLINEPSPCLSVRPTVSITTQINPGCCFLSVGNSDANVPLSERREKSQLTAGVSPVNTLQHSSRFYSHYSQGCCVLPQCHTSLTVRCWLK